MGRPPLGKEARSQTVSLRLTAAERDTLIEEYGTPAKGLRAALELLKDHTSFPGPTYEPPMAGTATAATQGTDIALTKALAQEVPLEVVAVREGVHRHKRGATPIATEWDKGTKVHVYACECGQEMR